MVFDCAVIAFVTVPMEISSNLLTGSENRDWVYSNRKVAEAYRLIIRKHICYCVSNGFAGQD